MLFDSISRWLRRFCALISWPPLSRASPAKSLRPAFTRSTLVWMRLVEWAMPSVWRSTMRDDLGHFLDRVADLAKARLGGAAALDAGLDLGRDGARLAGQLADGRGDLAGRGARVMRQLLHFGGDHREAAAGIAGTGRLDGRVQGQHVGLAGDRLDRRGDGLDLVHRRGEAGHPLAQLDDQVGQPLEAGDGALDRLAPGLELGLGLLATAAAPRRSNRDTRAWSASSRVVTSSSVSSTFRCSPIRSATPST